MSSLRVRAQNKLLNKLGAAKPSKNVQFDHAHANFEKTHDSVVALDSALRGFIVSLKGFHLSAQVLYGAIEGIGGTPDNTPEMTQTIAELKNAFVHVDVSALEDSVKKFENRVQRPATGWMGRATAIKNQVAEFNEEKLVYDHYTRKVMSLREARDKRSAAGKSEKPKDVEKLVRNEQKLAASTNTYAKLSDTTVSSLREFVNTRETTLAPIIQRLLEFRVQYAARITDESRLFQKMVRHDSAFDSMLGSLESFAARFSTGGKSGEGGPGSSAHQVDSYSASPAPTQEPELPVQALSFESFVGEAPPPLSSPVALATRTATQEWLPPDMPALPTPPNRNAFSAGYATSPPPIPVALALSPSSPSSANAFFDDHFGSAPSSPQTAATSAFQTAPVKPMAMMAPVSPSSAGFTPWDDIPSMPQQDKTEFGNMPFQFSTMPASPTAPPAALGWDSFGGADFQQLHQQNAMH